MLNFIRRLLCAHDYEFSRNLYGDQIIGWGYKRSVWKCSHCGKLQGRDELHVAYRDTGDLRGIAGPLPERGWD